MARLIVRAAGALAIVAALVIFAAGVIALALGVALNVFRQVTG